MPVTTHTINTSECVSGVFLHCTPVKSKGVKYHREVMFLLLLVSECWHCILRHTTHTSKQQILYLGHFSIPFLSLSSLLLSLLPSLSSICSQSFLCLYHNLKLRCQTRVDGLQTHMHAHAHTQLRSEVKLNQNLIEYLLEKLCSAHICPQLVHYTLFQLISITACC